MCTISFTTDTQDLTQVIPGQVVDAESQYPLPFATITVITSDPALWVISDDKAYFSLEKVPIGRHNIKISYIGYETQMIPELMVSTGKEIVLTETIFLNKLPDSFEANYLNESYDHVMALEPK